VSSTYVSFSLLSVQLSVQLLHNKTILLSILPTACITFANPLEKLHWSEHMILLDFYDATGGENWKIETNWGQTHRKVDVHGMASGSLC
jgi:hypothetical protein